MHARRWIRTLSMIAVTASITWATSAAEGIGIRGGLGTDIEGGLALGAGVNYLVAAGKGSAELGVLLFGGSFEETTEEFHTYEETTDLFVFGLLATYLHNHEPNRTAPYVLAGFGLGAINVEWEERSDTDSSLGTPLPGGGSKQAEDGSAGGTVFTVGGGMAFESGVDVRAELPIIVTFSAPGEASSVIPTFIATVGFRF